MAAAAVVVRGGGASGMLAVEISSSSPGSRLCCDLSLIVFGSNLLAQLNGNKSSFGPFQEGGRTLVSAGDSRAQQGRTAHQED